MALKLTKIVYFLQFFAIAIYVYASESSRFALLENGVGCYAMIYSLEDISIFSILS